jgi:hypothetical protein
MLINGTSTDVHGIAADQDAVRAAGDEPAGDIGEKQGGVVPMAGSLQVHNPLEVDGMQKHFRRM